MSAVCRFDVDLILRYFYFLLHFFWCCCVLSLVVLWLLLCCWSCSHALYKIFCSLFPFAIILTLIFIALCQPLMPPAKRCHLLATLPRNSYFSFEYRVFCHFLIIFDLNDVVFFLFAFLVAIWLKMPPHLTQSSVRRFALAWFTHMIGWWAVNDTCTIT